MKAGLEDVVAGSLEFAISMELKEYSHIEDTTSTNRRRIPPLKKPVIRFGWQTAQCGGTEDTSAKITSERAVRSR
jgi:hypothetical protein